ncbi:hypothetical protein KC19_5G136300 [Ceratodon purpureus]|uniref:Protein kinase domain-containing protein n=1 Tax=Ceratodon purpureus TaxID=3225 RepID=A0A8T0I3G1_CERPU|nr:hypothetical protein KC19_5G136300 [Ceratodon purpureus]
MEQGMRLLVEHRAHRRTSRCKDFSLPLHLSSVNLFRRDGSWPGLQLWGVFYGVLLLVATGTSSAQTCNSTSTRAVEVTALRNLYIGFNNGSGSAGFPFWGLGDPCGGSGAGGSGWGGVVCQRIENCTTTVSGLHLTNLNIKGQLSSSIRNLTSLTILTIFGNPELTGQIPLELGNLTQLVILDLHDNGFNGSIPDSCRDLKQLQFFDLSGNQIVGQVPRWLGNLKLLQRLDLSNNHFNGPLPVSSRNETIGLNNLSNLLQMSFSNNNLSGRLDDLSTLINLRILNGSMNQFNGTFPLLAPNLTVLDLSSNQITGELPNASVLGLQEIYMSKNKLSGNLSPLFLKSSNLQSLKLDGNFISGTLNLQSLQTTSGLQLISLVNNNITDVLFPATITLQSASNLTTLSNLFLGGNPYCSDPQADLLLQVCRSNPFQVLTKRTFFKKNHNVTIIITVVAAAIIVLLASIVSLVIIRRLLKRIRVLRDIQREFAKNEVQPNLYSYNELKVATEDFSPDMKLGQGGFGVVYKGVLPDGSEVAVKQLNNSDQVLAEFLNEIVTISNVRHRNLVKLKGCCIKGDQRILVYEYVENKNLAEALWDSPSKGGVVLDWPVRFNIILGIARGLAYLHEEVTPSIIHRDIKAANILLNKDLDPKIGDFGLALLFPALDDDRTHLSVNIAGTKGYLSPEYASLGQVSEKADVFSFGILLLEVISGRKNINLRLPAEQRYILEWAWKLYEAGTLSDFIDPKLADKSSTEDVVQVVKIGLACVQYAAVRRPTMSNVVSMLLGHQTLDPINRDSELSKGEIESMFATIQTGSLTPVDEDSPLLVGLPTASASGAFIELGKLKPR